MSLRLIQLISPTGRRVVACVSAGGWARGLDGVSSTYELAFEALGARTSLQAAVECRLTDEQFELRDDKARSAHGDDLYYLPPIDHPDPAHMYLTGTGLTHLGSAKSRDSMHAKAAANAQQTDSMRMFLMGLQGGKPLQGAIGVQPEWFYKGNGWSVVATGTALPVPSFASDGSEEPEIAGIYLNDSQGTPHRLGFCLTNEFSDHVMERENYLWLAHSKLRAAALGAELLTGPLPDDVRGVSRILRDQKVLWEEIFLTGEHNMSHSLANLEHHHFKYAPFRRPGDVHVHFFGTATLSFTQGIQTRPGDTFEIRAAPFHLPLRNSLLSAETQAVQVLAL